MPNPISRLPRYSTDGSCQDHDFIIRFLEPYLFPNGERKITEWMVTGISLGGNAAWRMMREGECCAPMSACRSCNARQDIHFVTSSSRLTPDPRIRIGAPIIGLPFEAFGAYLGARAVSQGLKWGPPTYPTSLVPLIQAPPLGEGYVGKKICSIHGGLDELVPYRFGKEKIAAVQAAAPRGDVDVFVQEGRGHVCTPEMLCRASEWFWRWGLSEA